MNVHSNNNLKRGQKSIPKNSAVPGGSHSASCSTSNNNNPSGGASSPPPPQLPKLGHDNCLVNTRWRNHSFIQSLDKNFVNLVFFDEVDFIDFQPSSKHIVAVITEAEVKSNNAKNENIRKKFARIYKLIHRNPNSPPTMNAVILYHMTDVTQPYYIRVQSLCVLDFTMTIMPFDSYDHLPEVLSSLKDEARETENPFVKEKTTTKKSKGKSKKNEVDPVLLAITGVNETQAENLKNKFGSLRGIAAASKRELASVIGDRRGKCVFDAMNDK
eukprot:TRINITY_DN42081_c0_g1_i1.p1 TRINITY_DN42081_c0_g1~~TRINITY_DN42081_c0_g1_i1.p1  ORF type:complete len:272 (+),score=57.82 TRINITY_DN42081_c0_g1_i1:172-987(+)